DSACLHGATFTQAKLDQADLTGTTVAFDQGTLDVRFCNPLVNGPFPPPPGFEPLNYTATAGLDLTTMTARTVCPNGLTVAANQRLGHGLQTMLTISNPATQWVPVGCTPSSVGRDEDAAGAAGRSSVVVETPHVRLFRFSLRHFRDLRRLADDPEARRRFFWNQQLTDARLKAVIQHYRLRGEQAGVTCWPAYRKSDRAFIGVCGFAPNEEAGGVEINVAVMPEFRGDPLVREMYLAVLRHGFTRLGLPRVYGMVEPDNTAALRFISKVGFRHLKDVTVGGLIPYQLHEITPADLDPGDDEALT
ncbi:MAG TPA: GNAT family protein, partial [Pyrinomonadaceae bacterium]|nr:GNAT family protein [Pyrinomonadaceae bacterium]